MYKNLRVSERTLIERFSRYIRTETGLGWYYSLCIIGLYTVRMFHGFLQNNVMLEKQTNSYGPI